jgi:UDP-N-acetylglucosamine--N-acetylmuramyl-(pentapeptide) pyrophosphoryl-undecaprenol N-acetylglucosamine transferase
LRRVLLTGGGTGGHLAIVAAVKSALLKRGHRPLYIGSVNGQDQQWFGEDSTFKAVRFLASKGVVNRHGWRRVAALGTILSASWEARRFMAEYEAGAVLSVGGFSAAPAAFAAIAGRRPLFIHEQNAVMGRLNRLIAPFARQTFASFGDRRVSYPVRRPFFETARRREEVRRIIFLGGSQGAEAINTLALAAAPALARRGIAISHQTGPRALETVRARYDAMGIEADCFAFDTELWHRLAAADLAVCRAGAGTVWELAAAGLPAIFIPYPYAAGDHQYHNARFIADRGGGWVVRQSAWHDEVLDEALDAPLGEMSDRLRTMIEPDGADLIARALLDALA